MTEKNLKQGEASKEEVEDLKEAMSNAAEEIVNILSEYNFNTIQGSMVLQQTSKAIRQAQAEKSVTGEEE